MKKESCKFCGASIREETVYVGAPPGRPVQMMIDVAPDDDGRVIQLADGRFRLLRENRPRIAPNVDAYRKHGERGCDGMEDVDDEQEIHA